jgi:hypothetical protein
MKVVCTMFLTLMTSTAGGDEKVVVEVAVFLLE